MRGVVPQRISSHIRKARNEADGAFWSKRDPRRTCSEVP
jgi:hypothetical protein